MHINMERKAHQLPIPNEYSLIQSLNLTILSMKPSLGSSSTLLCCLLKLRAFEVEILRLVSSRLNGDQTEFCLLGLNEFILRNLTFMSSLSKIESWEVRMLSEKSESWSL